MTKLDIFNGVFEHKKVLVTGDTGFKGSWLSVWLKELGAEVYGYALPPKSSHDNFVAIELNKVIHHQDGDVRDKDALTKYFSEVQPEIVFHLAAQPIVLESYKNPHDTFETNLMGTVNFFEAVRQTPSVKVALNITSDKCYQNNEWVWGYRENDPMGGNDPYSASKGCAELITQSYLSSFFNQTGTCHVASARAGNVIGGGDWADYRIVPDFFRALLDQKPLIIRNPGAIRPWQHVLEPLSGYLSLATKLYNEGKKYSGGWNFGPHSSNYQPVLAVIEGLVTKAGGQFEVANSQDKPHEANLLRLDIAKANHLLNWQPRLNFNETIEFTAQGYMNDSANNLYHHRVKQIKSYITKGQN